MSWTGYRKAWLQVFHGRALQAKQIALEIVGIQRIVAKVKVAKAMPMFPSGARDGIRYET